MASKTCMSLNVLLVTATSEKKRLISLEDWLHWKWNCRQIQIQLFLNRINFFEGAKSFSKASKWLSNIFSLSYEYVVIFVTCRRRIKLPPISNRYFQPGKSCCYYFVIVSSALKSQINIIKIISCCFLRLIPPLLQPLWDTSYCLLLVFAISFLCDETFVGIAIGQSRLIDSFPNKPATGITLPEKPTSCGSK